MSRRLAVAARPMYRVFKKTPGAVTAAAAAAVAAVVGRVGRERARAWGWRGGAWGWNQNIKPRKKKRRRGGAGEGGGRTHAFSSNRKEKPHAMMRVLCVRLHDFVCDLWRSGPEGEERDRERERACVWAGGRERRHLTTLPYYNLAFVGSPFEGEGKKTTSRGSDSNARLRAQAHQPGRKEARAEEGSERR